MRIASVIGRAVVAITLGVLVMPTEAPAQERKETKVKATVKSWQSKIFLKPKEDVDARKVEVDGKTVAFFIPNQQAIGRAKPTVGSEITDADGAVYVVTNCGSGASGETDIIVKPKPKP